MSQSRNLPGEQQRASLRDLGTLLKSQDQAPV